MYLHKDKESDLGKYNKKFSSISIIQRAGFVNHVSNTVATSVSEIKKITGLDAGKQFLPHVDGISKYTEKPYSIESEIDSTSIRTDERSKSSVLSKVTGMARNEEYLLLGSDLKGFYQAGHLIGDQLIGEVEDSFELFNLAPQVAEFNSPVYLNLMENVIRAAAANNKVMLKVELGYPSGDNNINLTVSDLLNRGVIDQESSFGNDVKIKNGKTAKLDDIVSIPRRIPNRWRMISKVENNIFPELKKSKEDKSLTGFYLDNRFLDHNLTTSNPFNVTVSNAVDGGEFIGLAQSDTRILDASQWTPVPSDQIGKEQIIGAIKSYFPDSADDEKLKWLFGVVQSEQMDLQTQIELGLLDLIRSVVTIKGNQDHISKEINEIKFFAKLARRKFQEGNKLEFQYALLNGRKSMDELSQKVMEVAQAEKEKEILFKQKQVEIQTIINKYDVLLKFSNEETYFLQQQLNELRLNSFKLIDINSEAAFEQLEKAIDIANKILIQLSKMVPQFGSTLTLEDDDQPVQESQSFSFDQDVPGFFVDTTPIHQPPLNTFTPDQIVSNYDAFTSTMIVTPYHGYDLKEGSLIYIWGKEYSIIGMNERYFGTTLRLEDTGV